MIIKFVNKYVSKLKGARFEIDERIATTYLLGVILRRIAMKIRGRIHFLFRKNAPFVGRYTKIYNRGKIVVEKGVSIGNNCYLDANSVHGIYLGTNTSIGDYGRIECSGSLKHLGFGIKVGNNVGLGSNTFYGCAGGIEIDDDTIIGNYVSFHSENHNYSDAQIPIRLQGVNHKGIKIGKNCWIGAKVTVLDGVVIETGCIVAAGAVLKEGTYKANGIYGGVPAKLLKSRTSSETSQ